jgi:hypothetical protein
MAKGKHATALFEVIHASKHYTSKDRGAGLLRTPKWWFKGRNKSKDPTLNPAATPSGPIPDPTGEGPAEPAASPASVPATEFTPTKPAARTPAVDVLVDSAHHRITLRVTYTSAIVAGFTVLVIVGLAYIIGRQMSRGPAQALGGPSTEQLRQSPPRPDVLDVNSTSYRAVAAPGNLVNPPTPQNNLPLPPQPSAASPAPTPAEIGRRINGLNYIIIQAYPDEANAKAAVDILAQHGVPATIERGLRGYTRDWYIVVGMQGFERISAQEYLSEVKRISAISEQFASRRSFKAFEPRGYKWDRP